MRNLTEENITGAVERVFETTPDPRLREIFQTLTRHIHGFAREVRLKPGEWIYAMEALLRAGKISGDQRNEFILFSDIFGLSALVDLMACPGSETETAFSQLGPFFKDGLPLEPSHIVDLKGDRPGEPVLFCGKVVDDKGNPICGAEVDEWQTDSAGLYDAQIPSLHGRPQFRCKLRTDAQGEFILRTINPKGYTVPLDGPGAELLFAAKRNVWRPGHFHFKLSAPGHRTLVTEIFPEGDPYLDNDAAFATRASLIVDLPKCDSTEEAKRWNLPVPFAKVEYTFRLAGQ